MEVVSASLAMMLLLAAAFALQLCVWITLAVLYWAPPAYAGLAAAWCIWTASDHANLSLIGALLAFSGANLR